MSSYTEQTVSSGFHDAAIAGIGRRKLSIGLRMTPMIDVIFLLLAFFVITAKFSEPEAFLPVKLPSPDSTQTFRTQIVEPLILEITEQPEGCLAKIGSGEEISISDRVPERGLAALAVALNQVCRSQQRTSEDPIELICHDEVTWDFVVKIYDVLHAMGAGNITFIMTEQADEEIQ